MTGQRWREKRDAEGRPIPNCWEAESGYTVALCRLPESRYTVTRPGGRLPFAYTGDRADVVRLIEADQLSQQQAGEGVCA